MTDEVNKFAQPFIEMAERIRKNDINEFAGAMLYVPPTGDVIAVLIVDPKKDAESFLAMVSGKIQIAQAELIGLKQQYGRR